MRQYTVTDSAFLVRHFQAESVQDAIRQYSREGNPDSITSVYVAVPRIEEPASADRTGVKDWARQLLAGAFTPEPWQIENEESGPDTFDGYTLWYDDGEPGTMIVARGFHQGPDSGLGDARLAAAAPSVIRQLLDHLDHAENDIATMHIVNMRLRDQLSELLESSNSDSVSSTCAVSDADL